MGLGPGLRVGAGEQSDPEEDTWIVCRRLGPGQGLRSYSPVVTSPRGLLSKIACFQSPCGGGSGGCGFCALSKTDHLQVMRDRAHKVDHLEAPTNLSMPLCVRAGLKANGFRTDCGSDVVMLHIMVYRRA